MKRVVLGFTIAVILTMVSAPVMAAAQWNFGASLRYGTFWSEKNAEKVGLSDLQNGGARLKKDAVLDWSAQGNSRIQMYMKSDALEGFVELGYDFDDNAVTTREYWGKYRFANKAYIAVGQQHQLFSQSISNQVWGDDLGMNGFGTAYAAPTPKIILGYAGFALAFSKPYTERSAWNNVSGAMDGVFDSRDVDTFLPQLQAGYEYFGEAWRIKVAGAYQHTKVKNIVNVMGQSQSKTVNAWLVGADGDVNFGPLYLALAASVGQNWSDAGWNDETGCMSSVWTNNYFARTGGFHGTENRLSGVGGRYKFEDTTSFMVSAVTAYRLTEALRLEAGAGYRYDDSKYFNQASKVWNVYVQAAYTVAPGFTITPEVGYIDFGKTPGFKQYRNANPEDAGYLWYAGAQWRMDF